MRNRKPRLRTTVSFNTKAVIIGICLSAIVGIGAFIYLNMGESEESHASNATGKKDTASMVYKTYGKRIGPSQYIRITPANYKSTTAEIYKFMKAASDEFCQRLTKKDLDTWIASISRDINEPVERLILINYRNCDLMDIVALGDPVRVPGSNGYIKVIIYPEIKN